MKVVYLENSDPYAEDLSESDIKMNDVCSLSDEQIMQLLQEIINTINSPERKQLKQNCEDLLISSTNLLTKDQIKIINEFKIKSSIVLFDTGYEMFKSRLDLSQDISTRSIERLTNKGKIPEPELFAPIEIPNVLKTKIERYMVDVKKKEKELAEKRKQKALEKAKKLVKELS